MHRIFRLIHDHAHRVTLGFDINACLAGLEAHRHRHGSTAWLCHVHADLALERRRRKCKRQRGRCDQMKRASPHGAFSVMSVTRRSVRLDAAVADSVEHDFCQGNDKAITRP